MNTNSMFDLPGHILILTGSPGAGKTTTAGTLVGASVAPAVHLHSDDFWHFIKKGAIPPYLPESHKQNEVVMGVIANAAEAYADGGYFVVVDGIVGPWFIQPFQRLRQPIHYIVLRPTVDEATRRCCSRGGGTLADPQVIVALHKQFSALGDFENHVIETAGHSPDDIVAAVYTSLVSGRFLLAARS